MYSFNAKAVYDLSARDRIWVVNIAGIDEIRLGLTESTDLEDEIANFDIRYDGWRSATGFQLATHVRVTRRGSLRRHALRGQGGPAGERPGGAGRPAAGCAPRGHHRRKSRRLLRGLARGRDDHQVRSDRARAVLRHRAGRRQLQGVSHRLHGGVALRQRHAVLAGARHRPVLSRHALPVVSDRRLPAGLEAGGRTRERHAWRTRSTTTPSCRRLGSARARASTCALPRRCRGIRAPARTISSRRSSSCRRFPRTRRSCPGAPTTM